MTNTSTSRRLIEFGDVLVVSLVYTGYGVLSLRVSSDLIDKAEKQAPPMGEQLVITDKYQEKMCFSVMDTEPNFVAYTGHQSQTFLFNWARFDQRSESDADDSTGALQAADEPANSAIKEHQEAESFSILRRLLCTKDNPRSIHLENSFLGSRTALAGGYRMGSTTIVCLLRIGPTISIRRLNCPLSIRESYTWFRSSLFECNLPCR